MMAELVHIRKKKSYQTRRETVSHDYKKLYRFTEENVEWMAEYFLGQYTETTRGGALSNKEKMRTYLRYVADPGFQNGIGEEMGIHQTIVCKVNGDVMQKIVNKANLWIIFPKSKN